MAEAGPRIASEQRLPGPVPRWEVPGWRERFGVVAGVTGRGEAGGPVGFDLGLWTSQPVGEVTGRWREFLAAEPGFRGAVLSHQLHGTALAWHDRPGEGWTIRSGVDGHLTAARSQLLLVTVADCVPVYLVDPRRGFVALLHAGWRGVAGGILGRGVRSLEEVGAVSPADLVMHCGVAISAPCYEVGPEVLQACGKVDAAGPDRLDLRALLTEQAAQLGIGEVTISGHCTARDGQHFFSHRRSGGSDGRQVAYLGMPDPGWAGGPLQ